MLATMRAQLLSLTIVIGLLFARPVSALEISSTWQLNETRRYQYAETANVGGVALALHSTFSERARALRSDGGVDLDITIEALEVCRSAERCQRVAPDAATRTIHAISDRRGRLVAPRVPTVSVHEGHIRLHAGAVPARPHEASFEIVPLGLFALLALPDHAVVPGAAIDLPLAAGVARWTLGAIDHELARVRVTMGARPRVSVDLAARFAVAGGALVEAGGVLIGWQPVKRNAVVSLQRL
jgi:hypothetical protein